MSKKQILIVEDESIVAEDLRLSLIGLGYEVPSVESSGEKAIGKIMEMRPDLVLMDIVLYGEMDGIDAAKEVHDRFDIPVVYLTSYSDEKILERAKITEPYCYIIKPFRERELHINIEIAIYKHKMEKKLKESKQWLDSTIKSLGEAVISTDKEGFIKTMNPIAEAMTGWKSDKAVSKPISTVFNIISEKPNVNVENPVTKVIREGMFYGLAEHTVLVAKEGMKTGKSSFLEKLTDNDPEKLEIRKVVQAAIMGDQYSISILANVGHWLGKGFAYLIQIFNPDMIILGGRMSEANQFILPPIQQSIHIFCNPELSNDLEIKVSELGSQAGMQGVSALLLEHVLDRN